MEFFLPDRAGTLTGPGEWPANGRFQINLALRPACAIFAPIYRDYSKSSFAKGGSGGIVDMEKAFLRLKVRASWNLSM